MIQFQSFLETEKCKKLLNNKVCLIVCTGKTIGIYNDKIQSYIKNNRPTIFAVNQYPDFFKYIPHIHLFTNNHRWDECKNSINSKSILMLGCRIKTPPKDNNYIKINYTDKNPDEKISYNNGIIYGYYRSVGGLGIMIAYLMKFETILVVGMDGHNLKDEYIHYYKDSENSFYGKVDISHREIFNPVMSKVLDNIKLYGIKFSLVTPTLFYKHFQNNIISKIEH